MRSWDQARVAAAYEAITGSPLRKHGAQLEGPCPRCEGHDRFFVAPNGYFSCRHCGPGKDGFRAFAKACGMEAEMRSTRREMRRELRSRPNREVSIMSALKRWYGVFHRQCLEEYFDRVTVTFVLAKRGISQGRIAIVTEVSRTRVNQILADPKLAHLADADLPEQPSVDEMRVLVPSLEHGGSSSTIVLIQCFLGGFRLVTFDGTDFRAYRGRSRRKRPRPRPPPRWHSRRTDYQVGALLDHLVGDRVWD